MARHIIPATVLSLEGERQVIHKKGEHMEELLQAYGQRLRAYRTDHGLSQAAIGRMIGVKQTHVSAFELGKAIPEDVLFSLRKFCDTTILLVERKEAPAPQGQQTRDRIEVVHTKSTYTAILEWLYIHDFDTTKKQAFIEFLKSVL